MQVRSVLMSLTFLMLCIKGAWNDIQIEKREYANPQSPIQIKDMKSVVENKVATSNVTHQNKTIDIKIANATTSRQVRKQKIKPPKPKEYHNKLYADEAKPRRRFKQNEHEEKYTSDQMTKTVTDSPNKENKENEAEKEKAEREWVDSMTFKGIGPKGMDILDDDTCDDFSRNARFNPFSVLYVEWFSFYYWAAPSSPRMHLFLPITLEDKKKIREILDPQVTEPIDWNATMVAFIDLGMNITSLLVKRNERGMYWNYPIVKDFPEKIAPIDIRLKQTSDNKYLAIMGCLSGDVFIFARKHEIPRKKHILAAVEAIGYRARRGRSYLYQGHEWMPIPERDELEYWAPDSYKEKYQLSEVDEEIDHLRPEDLKPF